MLLRASTERVALAISPEISHKDAEGRDKPSARSGKRTAMANAR